MPNVSDSNGRHPHHACQMLATRNRQRFIGVSGLHESMNHMQSPWHHASPQSAGHTWHVSAKWPPQLIFGGVGATNSRVKAKSGASALCARCQTAATPTAAKRE